MSSSKIKFIYSYGGKIMLCEDSGKFRYIGGTNKIITVDRRITYTELIVKLWDTCGASMSLRCKLPKEDFSYLVHIKSDKDLATVIEHYQWMGAELKINVVLDPLQPPIAKMVDVKLPRFYHACKLGDGRCFLRRWKAEQKPFY